MTEPETHRFADDGRFPNSPLPLLLYRRALPPDPVAMEQAFARYGWSNAWRNGIFPFHHFHSIAHEVLGIAAGTARVMFGGPGGREFEVGAGDVVVIPAGVGHRNLGSSPDFRVVGAYPGGAGYDTRRGEPSEHDAALQAIRAVPLPDTDPVSGQGGALRRLWAPGA